MKPWKQSLPEAPPHLSKDELWRREKALRRLDWFVLEFWEEVESFKIIWNWHIAAFCWHLMAVTYGLIQNLLYTAPPRTTKSRVLTMFWPCWEFARGMSSRYLTTGNDQALMIELSVDCRRVLESEKFQRWFPHVTIETDQNTKQKIDLSNGGRRQITSVKSTTTGKGGNRLVGDDLHDSKGNAKSFSDESGWFFGTFLTRGDPTGFSVVLGCQMLDPGDTANRIVREQLDNWVWLNFPLHYDPKRPCVTIPLPFIYEWVEKHGEDTPWFDEREPGENLWPAVFTPQRLNLLQSSMPERKFNAQFEQKAENQVGGVWKEEWLSDTYRVLEFENITRWGTSCDSPFKGLNRSKSGDPDYFAHIALGERKTVIETGVPEKPFQTVWDYYLLGFVNKQLSYPEMKAEFKRFVHFWNTVLGGAIASNLVEDKSSGCAIIDDLEGEVSNIDPYDPGKIKKELRFELVAPTIKAKRLHLPEPGAVITRGGKVIHTITDDFEPLKKQFITIPNSEDGHDDMADAFTQWDLNNRYSDQEPDPLDCMAAPEIDVYTVERRRRF